MTSESSLESTSAERPKVELDNLLTAAGAHYQAGRLGDAEAAYQAALALAPGDPAIIHNLGVAVATQGKQQDAIVLFEDVIGRQPRYVSAHYNRALALLALGRSKPAMEGFSRTCALQPEHYGAHRALGFLWLAEGDRGRALDHFARTYELRRGEDRSDLAAKSLTHTTRAKLLHDAEQFHFLAKRTRDAQRFTSLARAYEATAQDVSEQMERLSDRQIDRLGGDYNTPINIRGAPEVAERAVSERSDLGVLMHGFRESRAGAIYFDDLLTPQALRRLKSYLLESTIWHDFSHIGGFVASYLEDGLACPLILQIADEIRSTFRCVLGEHPLTQAWAFKGLQTASAIDVHADDAAISVNFWATPTEANLRPGQGGLVVGLVPPPEDWRMKGYDSDQERAVAFLEHNAHDRLRIPYRENRAVLFESRLFHWSDAPEFALGYENHRINLTLLYGRNGASPPQLSH
jgi:tetratricopeptide (TPR) repeat protein